MSNIVTIFTARKVLTMYPERPFATAVAVMDGRILGVGDAHTLRDDIKTAGRWTCETDDTFADKVIMPGIVDAHTHLIIPAMEYDNHFVSQVPWPNPEGGLFPTYPDKAAVLARLKELNAQLPPHAVLWGTHYDDNQAGGGLHRHELDTVSTTRPILVSNMVFHRFWANSRLLEMAGFFDGPVPEYVECDNGVPNGTLIEGKGFLAAAGACPDIVAMTKKKMQRILSLFRAQGVTTVSELTAGTRNLLSDELTLFRQLLEETDQGLRCMVYPHMHRLADREGGVPEALNVLRKAMDSNSARVRVAGAKLYHDGSIISRTSPLDWPGYWDGTPNRHMQYPAEEIHRYILELHALGIDTVTHTNSNLGVQTVLDAVEEAQHRHFRPDMRHRVDHCYTITTAQLQRAKRLGVGVQFFTPQIYYYGDNHVRILGLDRAENIVPVGTAERLGVSWGFHCDPPGTPPLLWLGAWATTQRQTLSGRVLGPGQCVSVEVTLRAMTLEAAWQMRMDNELGSIEFGKKADFCVLEADPLEVSPQELKDMPVWGTVMEGRKFKA